MATDGSGDPGRGSGGGEDRSRAGTWRGANKDWFQEVPRLQMGCVQLGEEFARGSYARVRRGNYCGQRCALKEFECAHLSESTVPDLIQREAMTTWRLQHETVVEFYGFLVDPPKVLLAFELCER